MLPPEELTSAIRTVLANTAGVRFAMLFGSIARGTATQDSDVDLAVDAKHDVDLPKLAADLSLALGREVDLVALRTAGVPLLGELIRDGVVVFEGVRHAASTWRARTLSDLEVDGPWYARMRDAWLSRVREKGFSRG